MVLGANLVSGPLAGVRIVMMGGLGPAPFCGMLLGDLGADVVRVDPLAGVDGALPIDYTVRRSQRSVAADVKDPRGRHLILQLVGRADAFVEAYRPGVAERLGIGPERPWPQLPFGVRADDRIRTARTARRTCRP